jgi:ribosome-associated toxin RatA of RatAB toxin-antitoxin module
MTKLRYHFMAIAAMYGSIVLLPAKASCLPLENSGVPALSPHVDKDYQGISVQTSDLDDGVTGVVGKVYIDASPRNVWTAITDYNNQKNFVPKLIDSGLISDNGSEQVMFEKGKTGVMFFKKTVFIKLSLHGDYLQRLSFRLVEGDFKVYEGDWFIERASDGKGTLLTFKAKIKPDFFAPAMFVRKVQENDLPMVLEAMKKRAESAEVTLRVARASNPKHSTQPMDTCPIAD